MKDFNTNPFLKPVILQKELGKNKIQCLTCERKCVIGEGKLGWCKTKTVLRCHSRESKNPEMLLPPCRSRKSGNPEKSKSPEIQLYTNIYGMVSSISVNPIEKKPIFHFYPGSYALTSGNFSCNFSCSWCQNWEISKCEPNPGNSYYVTPDKFALEAVRSGCLGTSISFNEPTLSLEWLIDAFKVSKKRGLYNTIVTNGYMTEDALKLMIDSGLDAANFDIKGSTEFIKKYCDADVEKVWRNLKIAHTNGVHIEITTLLIPELTATEETIKEISNRIANELSAFVPFHLTLYYPAYKFDSPAISGKKAEELHQVAKDSGLKFVYLGNLFNHRFENTYCPKCGKLIIERKGYEIKQIVYPAAVCPDCGERINIIQ